MGINKRDEGKKVNSNINVTPMVDVMLVLLIIFMVITPMLNNKVNVTLPTANAAIIMDNANKEDAVIVAVTRDGRTFLGGDQSPSTTWGEDFGEAGEQDRQGGLSARGHSRQLRQGDGRGGPDPCGGSERAGTDHGEDAIRTTPVKK
jgi:biopolymer transport protein ExbD